MSERIPNCDRWHPGVPSQWSDYVRKKAGVVTGVRRVCLACNRARCKAHWRNEPAPPPLTQKQATTIKYDLLPRLNWTPPSI